MGELSGVMTAAVPKRSVDGVTKLFQRAGAPDLVVMQDVRFDVRKLEFVAIVGPSGCGKSARWRIIAGLGPASAGTVRIDGRPRHGSGAGRAMVFQGFDLFPWCMTPHQNPPGLESHGVPRAAGWETVRR